MVKHIWWSGGNWVIAQDAVKYKHNKSQWEFIFRDCEITMNSLALLRGSLWSDLSRGTRVGLRLRWLCFSLSSYSSGSIRWWDGTVDRKVKNQIISWQDLKNTNLMIGKGTVTLDFVLREIDEYFGKHLLVSFWEWDEKIDINLCLYANYEAEIRTCLA